jgi:hypothetical protein
MLHVFCSCGGDGAFPHGFRIVWNIRQKTCWGWGALLLLLLLAFLFHSVCRGEDGFRGNLHRCLAIPSQAPVLYYESPDRQAFLLLPLLLLLLLVPVIRNPISPLHLQDRDLLVCHRQRVPAKINFCRQVLPQISPYYALPRPRRRHRVPGLEEVPNLLLPKAVHYNICASNHSKTFPHLLWWVEDHPLFRVVF